MKKAKNIRSAEISRAKIKLDDGITKKPFEKVDLLNILTVIWRIIAIFTILLFCCAIYVADKTKDIFITYLLSLPFFLVFLSTIIWVLILMLKDIIKSKKNRLYYLLSILLSAIMFFYTIYVVCLYDIL